MVGGVLEDGWVARGYRPVVRDQVFLLPADMREWLAPDHPVWLVISIIDRLDTSVFHAGRRVGGVGRQGYDPDMLVTLLVWAWLQGMRSSRRIERACADVVSYRVICGGDVPDHVTISRFRADNHHACAQLFAQVLMLAAQLGLGRLETVALDGVKIASNASLSANRTVAAARAAAATLAAHAAAAHAAADVAEDSMFGDSGSMSVPRQLSDPAVLADRLDAATAELADSDDDSDDDSQDGPGDLSAFVPSPDAAPAAGPVAADRRTRITDALADLEVRAAAAAHAAAVGREREAAPVLERLAAGERFAGRVPLAARVALLETRLTEKIAECEAKHRRWQSNRHKRSPGRRPVPIEANAKIRDLRAALAQAHADLDEANAVVDVESRTVNLTDPQSRIQPLRGGGWLQGYNCQAVTTADGLIVATGVGTSPVDTGYYTSMIAKAEAAADLMSGHRPDTDDAGIEMVLADAGYCSRDNLTAPGPARLIATAKARDLHAVLGDPIDETDSSDPITVMTARLRDPDTLAVYQQRSHIAETPFGHAKHNWGFRRFTSRGVDRARSEWDFHAAVHNIAKILTHLAGTPHPA